SWFVFFFSSRRRHTRLVSDWSSDVCSSDLAEGTATLLVLPALLLYLAGRGLLGAQRAFPGWSQAFSLVPGLTGVYLRRAFYRLRSEEGRGGEEGGCRGWAVDWKNEREV